MFLEKEYEYKGHTIKRYWYRDQGSEYNPSYGRHRRYNRIVTVYRIPHVDQDFDRLKDAKAHLNERR